VVVWWRRRRRKKRKRKRRGELASWRAGEQMRPRLSGARCFS